MLENRALLSTAYSESDYVALVQTLGQQYRELAESIPEGQACMSVENRTHILLSDHDGQPAGMMKVAVHEIPTHPVLGRECVMTMYVEEGHRGGMRDYEVQAESVLREVLPLLTDTKVTALTCRITIPEEGEMAGLRQGVIGAMQELGFENSPFMDGYLRKICEDW